jgi:hypothetical protein
MKKLLVGLLLSFAAASAATLTLNLDSPTLSVLPGQNALFTGTLTSTYDVTLDLNSISVNLGGDFLIDTLPFFLTGPLTIAANSTSAPFEFFTATPNDPFTGLFGSYSGTITIFGGAQVNGLSDPSVLDQLGDQSFSVVALDPVAAVPEPASGSMLLLAAAGAFVYRRRVANTGKLRESQSGVV